MVKASELTKTHYRSGEVAKMIGVTTRTVQTYCRKGVLDEVMNNDHARLIPRESVVKYLDERGLYFDDSSLRRDIVYARVSTGKQKKRGDLDRQVQDVVMYASSKNPVGLTVIQDVGSGLNDKRKGILRLIDMVENDEVSRVFVNYRDRLTRFGFNYLETVFSKHNTEIIIVSNDENNKTVSEELAEDIISIIHSFSGKLYGMRRKLRDDIYDELSKGE